MGDREVRRCSRCGRERPLVNFTPGAPGSSALCSTCRGFDNAAGNTFGLLHAEVTAVEGGWRVARTLDGGFAGWLCPHVHRTPQEAEDCPRRESILRPSAAD